MPAPYTLTRSGRDELDRDRCLYVDPTTGYRCALDVHPLPGDPDGGQMHYIEIIRRNWDEQ